MLSLLGYATLDALMDAALPMGAAPQPASSMPAPTDEVGLAAELRSIAGRNSPRRSMIGMGYCRTVTPAAVRRHLVENPSWYTPYTPYQSEISQGRLEALFVFQTVVAELCRLPFANASLLDEATAAAEGMALAHRASKSPSNRFIVDGDVHPQVLAVIRTRAEPIGIEIEVADGPSEITAVAQSSGCFGALASYPTSLGRVRDWAAVAAAVHEAGGLFVADVDLLGLTLLKPPGEWGADVAIGSAQRLGAPMAAGGPHAAFMAVRAGLERQLPGRLVGLSRDADGRAAFRLALGTREQHIRRERATSNICTAQALHATVAAAFAVFHGPDGLRGIAGTINARALHLAEGLSGLGATAERGPIFDTVVARMPGKAQALVTQLADVGIDVRAVDPDRFAVTVDELTTGQDVEDILDVTRGLCGPDTGIEPPSTGHDFALPASMVRTSGFMQQEWFHRYRSETEFVRWLRRLADADFGLDRGMIPLGSCTMKLNPAAAMEPITWPEFADIHPFGPSAAMAGFGELVRELEQWLAELTGYDAASIQPNAGSQGELAGLLAIRAYLRATAAPSDPVRDICLIPTSAHGTNAASAAMAGFRVVAVKCDQSGGVDLDDLDLKLTEHGPRLGAIMLTYPSTYGVFDDTITAVADRTHRAGGQVYVDGANLNALLGHVSFGSLGADASHLNLHKTFAIPHGGGGPGVGPVAVKRHLAAFLPRHPIDPAADGPVGPAGRSEEGDRQAPCGPVSAAPWGNAGVLPIAYAYMRLLGGDGLRSATQHAVLAANYVATRLAPWYPVLYRGRNGLVAHECILDLREITKASGVTAEDVAKRLIDYGFHAPTLSFPIPGTLMVEPTESESLAELDRFCDAMIGIRGEVDRVAAGEFPLERSPLRLAPHPAACLVEEWDRPYSRREAVFPADGAEPATVGGRAKYWPPVSRVDNTGGDRNLCCSWPAADETGGR